MRVGVVFPQTEIGADPAAVRDYAQTAESLGYSHLLVYDHVLGAGTANREDWRGPYTADNPFHEPFVLFGYLAAITQRMELVTGVIVLPQRQTALVAKQAAEVDVLSGGRLRLGVGIGWNYVEYEALGMDFHDRGRRIEEQITVLRALWTEPVADFQGHFHRIPEAGINPLPVQRPIPIWIGGQADIVLQRTARLADGWFPQMRPDAAREPIEKLRAHAQDAGRDPDSIGIEARLNLRSGDAASWRQQLEAWRDLGATHIGINTMGMGLPSPQAHIETIERVWRELDLASFA
jgi:probable F420-dependent oxidoreductase